MILIKIFGLLYMPSTKYEKCISKNMARYMTFYKRNDLKQKNGKLPVNRKQAIAISINQSERKCQDLKTKKDIKKIREKIQKKIILKKKSKPIFNHPLKIQVVKDALELLKQYKKENNMKKHNELQSDLMAHIIMNIPVLKEQKPLQKTIIKLMQSHLLNTYK